MDEHIVMGDGRLWNEVEFELHRDETNCVVKIKIAVVKERHVAASIRATRILE